MFLRKLSTQTLLSPSLVLSRVFLLGSASSLQRRQTSPWQAACFDLPTLAKRALFYFHFCYRIKYPDQNKNKSR